MKPFKYLLTEAVDYEMMMSPVFKDLKPELKPNIESTVKNEIAWAKTNLKKQDRVTWYLLWIRASILQRYNIELWKKELQKAQKTNLKSFPNAGPFVTECENFQSVPVIQVKHTLKHYFSLGIDDIDKYIFKPFDPFTVLSVEWREQEREWSAGKEGHIAYMNQPLPEDTQSGKEDDESWVIQPLIDFKDGYYWIDLMNPYCKEEGEAMGHCGNTAAYTNDDTVLSFRKLIKRGNDKEHWMWYPSMTFIYNKQTGALGEMKGRGNKKPEKKYHKYILALLELKKQEHIQEHDGEYFVATVKGGGYAPKENFALADLTPEVFDKLIEERPELLDIVGLYKKFGNTLDLRTRITELWKEQSWYSGFEWLGKDVAIVGQDISLPRFLKDNGNQTARWMGKVMDEGGTEFDFNTSRHDIEEFVNDNIDENKLIEYLKKEFPEPTDENDTDTLWFDEEEDDPTDYFLDNEPELYYEISNAIRDGWESGSQNEVYISLKANLDEIKLVNTDGDTEDVLAFIDPEKMWDEPVKILMKISEIIDMIEILPNFEEGYYNFKIEIQEQQDYSNYDEEAAKEQLGNAGFGEFLKK